VAANDMLAVGALRHIEARRIRCPTDISLVGMNDMPFMDSIAPALTTIRTPTADLGKHAAEILVAMIHGAPIENRRVVLNPELVVRNSVMPTDRKRAGASISCILSRVIRGYDLTRKGKCDSLVSPRADSVSAVSLICSGRIDT
jgi:hypothetical protein